MRIFKIIIIVILLFAEVKVVAQVNINIQSKDSTFFSHSFSDRVSAIKKSITNNWNKVFVDFTKSEVSLIGAINFSKQIIDNKSINSIFNYDYATVSS